jgi:hypothetical protein
MPQRGKRLCDDFGIRFVGHAANITNNLV